MVSKRGSTGSWRTRSPWARWTVRDEFANGTCFGPARKDGRWEQPWNKRQEPPGSLRDGSERMSKGRQGGVPRQRRRTGVSCVKAKRQPRDSETPLGDRATHRGQFRHFSKWASMTQCESPMIQTCCLEPGFCKMVIRVGKGEFEQTPGIAHRTSIGRPRHGITTHTTLIFTSQATAMFR